MAGNCSETERLTEEAEEKVALKGYVIFRASRPAGREEEGTSNGS